MKGKLTTKKNNIQRQNCRIYVHGNKLQTSQQCLLTNISKHSHTHKKDIIFIILRYILWKADE